MKNYLKIIHLDAHSLIPYHQQLSDAFMVAIEREQIVKDDVLPSINDLSIALDVSRNLVKRAYDTLKRRGVVGSIHGKGHYISNVHTGRHLKVLLLLNKLSSPKKTIYDAFAKKLGEDVYVDFFIYNSNIRLFKKVLFEKMDQFDKIVVVPHFVDGSEQLGQIISSLPSEKIVLIGSLADGLADNIAVVYENYQQDIFNALESMFDRIRRFKGLILVFPKDSYFSTGILFGFIKFCKKFAFEYQILSKMKGEAITRQMLYITLTDDDLLELIALSKEEQLVIKEDFGIISYNETPFKKYILDGITTISADFNFIGVQAAELVAGNLVKKIRAPFLTTIRPSL